MVLYCIRSETGCATHENGKDYVKTAASKAMAESFTK